MKSTFKKIISQKLFNYLSLLVMRPAEFNVFLETQHSSRALFPLSKRKEKEILCTTSTKFALNTQFQIFELSFSKKGISGLN